MLRLSAEREGCELLEPHIVEEGKSNEAEIC